MKKTVFAVLSLLVLAVMIISAVSCGNAPSETQTEADTKAETTETETGTEDISYVVTETTSEDTTVEEATETEEQNDAYQIYKAAAEKTNAKSDMRQKQYIEQNITMAFLGLQIKSVSVTEAYDEIQDRNGNGTKYLSRSKTTTDNGGVKQESEYELIADSDKIYYKDAPSNGYTVMNRDEADFQSINEMVKPENMTVSVLSEEVFAGAKIKENEDGSKTVSTAPDPETMNGIFKEIIDRYKQTFASAGADSVTCRAGGAEMIYTVSPDGYIIHSESRMIVYIDMTIAGIPVSAISDATTVTDFADPDKPVVIEIPPL